MKDLSIIIATTNNKKLVGECLLSIYHSTHKVGFEIIVVDNASSDGSQDMVLKTFPEVTLIENKENAGFVHASNQGLKIYQGRYAMLLNDDTIVSPGALDILVEFMDAHPDAGACGPKLLNIDGTIQHQGGIFGRKFWQAKKPIVVDFVIGAALVVRREVIDKIGIMDENLFFYNDDLDWCLSMREAGYKIYFVPQAQITHYGGYSSRRTFKPRLFIEGFKGGLYFCRKHYGEAAFNVYRFLLVLILILVLPFKLFNQVKLGAYSKIISIAWRGQIPKPVIK
ncbi:MAG: glycosyltransferase family 2 protein [Candidatus Saganbacteria bacterium]|nr:glycosyltransferase family 2 protein [Candidatus Saganbacteria bacterium]